MLDPIASSASAASLSASLGVAASNFSTTPLASSGVAGDTVSSMSDLKNSHKDLYDVLMMGIANSIIGQAKQSNERLVELMRDERKKNEKNS